MGGLDTWTWYCFILKYFAQVNETYKCKYIPGIQRADIDHDDLFNCQSKEPSNVEIIKLLFTL